jgi:hypothetical protein
MKISYKNLILKIIVFFQKILSLKKKKKKIMIFTPCGNKLLIIF